MTEDKALLESLNEESALRGKGNLSHEVHRDSLTAPYSPLLSPPLGVSSHTALLSVP